MMTTATMSRKHTKTELVACLKNCLFTCQSLYNISALGRWNDVSDAGYDAISHIADDSVLTENEFNVACKNMYGAMYAAAEGDD